MRLLGILLLLLTATARAEEDDIEYSIQIIGDRELPRSLFIVPWKPAKSSDLPVSAQTPLDELLTPLDPVVYLRRVEIAERLARIDARRGPARPVQPVAPPKTLSR